MNGNFSCIFIKYFSAKRESRGNDAFYRCNVMSIDCQARENRLAVKQSVTSAGKYMTGDERGKNMFSVLIAGKYVPVPYGA